MFINTFRISQAPSSSSSRSIPKRSQARFLPFWQSFLPYRIGALIKSLQRAETWSWQHQTGPERAALAESQLPASNVGQDLTLVAQEAEGPVPGGPDTRDTVKCFLRVYKTHVDCAEGLKLKNKYMYCINALMLFENTFFFPKNREKKRKHAIYNLPNNGNECVFSSRDY